MLSNSLIVYPVNPNNKWSGKIWQWISGTIIVMGITLDHTQEETHTWYCKCNQEPRARELTAPRYSCTTIILPNGTGIETVL